MKKLYEDVSFPVQELVTLVFNHFGKSPMEWTGIDKLTEYAHNAQFVDKVFSLCEIAKSQNNLILGINPSQYYKIIYKFQLASKSLNISVDRIVDCYLYLANYGIQVYNRNLQEIKQLVKTQLFQPVDSPTIKKSLLFLCALIRSYSETLFCDEHTIAGEIYSPIPCDEGFLIARKYSMLNAQELNTDLCGFPFEKVNIYIKYCGNALNAQTDIVGNLLTSQNLAENMVSFHIDVTTINGQVFKVEKIEDISNLVECFQSAVLKMVATYKQLPLLDRLWKKIECEYYALKPSFQLVGKEWRPQYYDINIEEIASESRGIVKLNNEISTLTDDETIKRKLFVLNDPREHFTN